MWRNSKKTEERSKIADFPPLSMQKMKNRTNFGLYWLNGFIGSKYEGPPQSEGQNCKIRDIAIGNMSENLVFFGSKLRAKMNSKRGPEGGTGPMGKTCITSTFQRYYICGCSMKF